jgi:hypothetical protein
MTAPRRSPAPPCRRASSRRDVGGAVDLLRLLGGLDGPASRRRDPGCKAPCRDRPRRRRGPCRRHGSAGRRRSGSPPRRACSAPCSRWPVAHRQHVVLRAGPPDADEVLHREADVRGFLDGDLVHHAPAPHQSRSRALAADLQPLRLLLLTGMVDRQQAQLEAVLFRPALPACGSAPCHRRSCDRPARSSCLRG